MEMATKRPRPIRHGGEPEVPLGYVSRDKKFFIEGEEAERVRTIFRFIGLDGLAITSCLLFRACAGDIHSLLSRRKGVW
jgi:hypothetical protein